MSSDEILVRPDGSRITEHERQRGLRINIMAAMLAWVWLAGAGGMPITMFYEALTASGIIIGLDATLRQLAIVVQIPSALYVERLPSRRTFWAIFSLSHRLLWFVPALLALLMPYSAERTAWITLAICLASSLLAHAAVPTWMSWMADLVPERTRGRFWARRQGLCTLAHLLAMALMGWLLDAMSGAGQNNGSFWGFGVVFLVAAAAGVIDIIVHLWVPEPRPSPAVQTAGFGQRLLAPLRDPDFCWVTLSFGVWFFGMLLAGQFGQIYLRRAFGASYTHLSALVISGSLGVVVFSFVFGYIMDRVGSRALAAITMAASPLCLAVWFFLENRWTWLHMPWGTYYLPRSVLLILAVNLVAGGLYNGVTLCQMALTGALAPKEGRTMAMAVHWTFVGIMGALGPLVGGMLVDWIAVHPLAWRLPSGLRLDFQHILVALHMAISWLVAVPMLLLIRRQPKDLPVSTALRRLLIINPFRIFTSVSSIHTMSAATSPAARARAAYELGQQRTAIAVTDLIARLDDPSASVREEAVHALGRINSPEAVDALIAKLQDPHSDLCPQIARALRDTRDPRSVDALVGKLAEPDRETRSETARTLGEIGDPRAASHLLELLRSSEDDKVVSASSDALAKLGEIAAIHEILPRLRATRNPVLKRSLSVAIGNLLGERDGFYRVLVREEDAAGEEAARLFQQLRRMIRSATPPELMRYGESLIARTGDLEAAYEDEKAGQCADLLFDLAIGLAALRYRKGQGLDRVFLEEILWRDPAFGMAVWFLNLLRGNPSAAAAAKEGPEMIEILLGLYVLAGR